MITTALRNLASGVMLGLISTVLSLSFASLIFGTGNLADLQSGISIFLMTAIVGTLAIGLLSSGKGVAAIPLPAAAMIAALSVSQDLSPGDTRLMMISLAVLTVTTMFLVGQSGVGRITRYLPLPVVTGLMAGIGWLFLYGGLSLAEPALLSVSGLMSPTVWMVIGFAALLFFLQKKLGGSLILPTGFLILVFLFNLLGAGMPDWSGNWFVTGKAQSFFSMGWLPAYANYDLDGFTGLPWGGVVAAAVISVLVMLVQASALENETGVDLDLNRELYISAGAGFVTGAVGGSVSALSLEQTQLNQQLGGEGKAPAIIAAVIILLICLAGSAAWQYLPLPAVAVILVYLGFRYLDQWLISARNRFNPMDYQLVVVLFVAMAAGGVQLAALLAVLVTVPLLARQFSKQRSIHLSADATVLHSLVERPLRHNKALEKYGDRVRTVRLKGDLAFGAAYSLQDDLEPYLQAPCVFVILDFARAQGFDASTASVLQRLHNQCQQRKIILLLSSLPPGLKDILVSSGMGIMDDSAEGAKLTTRGLMKVAGQFSDWDRALEWCESELLSRLPTTESGEFTLESLLKERMDILPYEVVHLVRYFEPVSVKEGEYFIRQGQNADAMYLITKGKVEIQLDLGEERYQRLKTMMPGTIIGETGLYASSVRTISAKALENAELMKLDAQALKEMEANNQLMAIRLHRFVVLLMNDRLSASEKVLKELF
ncbi:cyclic nucleotide-binding domain-containing protein [Oceanospirillum sediminis]|uniref:SLC26A/SulP transporter family protein n=1 Tax=Oceanospirillum sediminis TaxID=2760088 RepID=A0A839IUD1_9GAMM|nr:cyclic nucleotide-binding domain-containing protein [Oceanospirillum sediminis]MBB1487726.1 SLC26A/SulP transporter family protein [Oceanospirillum sediminis]